MSKLHTGVLFRAGLVLVLSGITSSVFGLANRVFVSARSGNNANTCDNILAPCQTFAGAVTKLNPGGEAIVLDSGGYGPVTITQSVTIEAPPGVTAFIHPPAGDAITINAGASDTVVLRGLTLNGGSANGIVINTVGMLFVEDCSISGFFLNGIVVTGASTLIMKNSDVKGCFNGIEIENTAGSVTASLDHCHLDGNDVGFRAATSAPGQSMTTATNSAANNNSAYGWICGGASSGQDRLFLENCSGSGNGQVGLLSNSSNASTVVRYSNCTFSGNDDYGVDRLGSGTVESRGNNTITGNGTAPTTGVIGAFVPL